jgi:hypothetical protein
LKEEKDMTTRSMLQGFHFDASNSGASVLIFFAALIAVSIIGAGVCEIMPWR